MDGSVQGVAPGLPWSREGCVFLDKHGVLDLREDPEECSHNDTERFLWALRETIGRRDWQVVSLSKAGRKRAAETVEWLASLQALQHLDQIVFTSDRTTKGTCKVWPGEMQRFGYRRRYRSLAVAHSGFADCQWYPGGKDDYIAGYSAEFPGQALIAVDDGIDILQAARERVQHLCTVHVDPWDVGPAELANVHENATDLSVLLLKLQAMTRALTQ